MSRYELSVICQSALLTKKAPTVILRNSSGKLGAPSMIRTCDLLVRSQTLYPAELWALQKIHVNTTDSGAKPPVGHMMGPHVSTERPTGSVSSESEASRSSTAENAGACGGVEQ